MQNLPWLKKARTKNPEQHLVNANQQIQTLLTDTSVPSAVRQELFQEFAEMEAISEKLQHSEIHIAAFGRVGTGKSSLLNALLGRKVFSTSPLHGETQFQQRSHWDSVNSDHVVLIDTPGMREVGMIDSDEGLENTFTDLYKLIENCRFQDCTHTNEPGCAVRKAVEKGEIDEKRLENFRKLEREASHYKMTVAEKRKKDKQFGKMCKEVISSKKKNKY